MLLALKILVTYPGDRLTGAGRYAADICRELLRRDHEVLVALHGEGPAKDLFLADPKASPEVVSVPMPNLRRSLSATVRHLAGVVSGTHRLSDLIREYRPDVVLAHCIFNVWSVLSANRWAVPLVALVHETTFSFPAPLYTAWAHLLTRASCRVIFYSKEMEASLSMAGSKAVAVRPGIDSSVFHPGVDGGPVRRELANGNTGPLIVCASHLMEAKGQLDLVDAMPRVVAVAPGARVAFVGGTNGAVRNESYLMRMKERIRQLGLEARVCFAGPRSDMAPVFASADLVVNPSHGESFGMVPVEASAVGVPVVCTDVGVARELSSARPAIEIVPPKRPDILADAILRSLDRRRLTAPIDRAWCIEGCVDEVEKVLRQAAGDRSTKASPRSVIHLAKRSVSLAVERMTRPSMDEVRSVNVAVTYYCNSRCTMCNIWQIYRRDRSRAAAELSLEDLRHIFSSRRFAKLSSVSLTGGEPFLRRDLVEIAGFFLENFPSASLVIPTDSVSPGLTLKKVRQVIDRFRPGRDRFGIAVSLDGQKEAHNRQRGMDCYDKAIEVLHELAELNLSLHVSYTVTTGNTADVLAIYKIAQEIGAAFSVQIAQGSSNYYGDNSTQLNPWKASELDHVDEQVSEIADDRWSRLGRVSKMTDTTDYFLRRMVDYHREPRRIFTCYSGIHSCFIDPYGDVYACLMLDRKLGNAKRDGFDTVWNGPVADEVRQSIERKECHCWTPCEACPSLARSLVSPVSAIRRLRKKRKRYAT